MDYQRKADRRARFGVQANTDDIRFAPALEIVKRLLEDGAHVRATDPKAMEHAATLFPLIQYHEDPYEALRGADAALLCTEWDAFRALDWARAGKLMARKLVIDGRNVYSPALMRELGFEYYSFGRETPASKSRTATA